MDKAIDIAKSVEQSLRQSREVLSNGALNKVTVSKQGRPDVNNRSNNNNYKCIRCHGQHAPSACRFIDELCRYCAVKGHIEKACLKKKKEADSQDTEKKDAEKKDSWKKKPRKKVQAMHGESRDQPDGWLHSQARAGQNAYTTRCLASTTARSMRCKVCDARKVLR